MPTSNAFSMSASDLPKPEKTIFAGLPPAARTRASSPPVTISKPAPSFANTLRTAKFEFDFTAKQI